MAINFVYCRAFSERKKITLGKLDCEVASLRWKFSIMHNRKDVWSQADGFMVNDKGRFASLSL